MALIAKEQGGGTKFPLPPEGANIARCIWVIDLGHHKTTYAGVEKMQPKVLLGWELLSEERMTDGRPFVLSRRFTLSLGEKSALRPSLEAWRGRKFTREELDGFDLKNCIGKYAFITVTHEQKDGREYATVAGIGAVPKGFPLPEGVNDTVYYSITDEGGGIVTFPESLPEWVKKIIRESQEWSERQSTPEEKVPQRDGGIPGMPDDIPF